VTQSGEMAWKYSSLDVDRFWRCYAYKLDDPEILNQTHIEFE